MKDTSHRTPSIWMESGKECKIKQTKMKRLENGTPVWSETKTDVTNSQTAIRKQVSIHLNLVAKFGLWMEQVIRVTESNGKQLRDPSQASALLMSWKKNNKGIEFETVKEDRILDLPRQK